MHRDVLQDDVAQRRGILHGHMHEEVVFTRHVEGLDHAGRGHDRLEQLSDTLARVPAEAYADHRLQRQPERCRIDQHAHAREHTARTERADAIGTRRLGDAEFFGERLVGAAGGAHHGCEDPQVELIEGGCRALLFSQVRLLNGRLGLLSSAQFDQVIADFTIAPNLCRTFLHTRAMDHFDTLAVHAGRADFASLGVHTPPLDLSSTYPLPDVERGGDSYEALATGGTPIPGGSHVYARLWNPTVSRFEEALATLEAAEASVAFASGMAALTAAILSHTVSIGRPHVVAVRPLYGGSDHLLASGLLGTQATFCGPDEVGASLRPETGLVIVETPANPTLELVDIAAVVAQANDVPVLVDNTFATPVLQQPLAHGATMSLHSATKYLGGHGDVVGGVIACGSECAAALRRVRAITGGILHPLAAYLLHRGLPTLPLRMRAQQETAAQIARRLTGDDAIAEVFYPSLHGDPRGLLTRQQHGTGAMVSLRLRGGYDAAARVAASTRLFTHAVSLGGVDSLIQHPAALTHRPVAPEARPDADILRLSIGLEHVDDLFDDLRQALALTRDGKSTATTVH